MYAWGANVEQLDSELHERDVSHAGELNRYAHESVLVERLSRVGRHRP